MVFKPTCTQKSLPSYLDDVFFFSLGLLSPVAPRFSDVDHCDSADADVDGCKSETPPTPPAAASDASDVTVAVVLFLAPPTLARDEEEVAIAGVAEVLPVDADLPFAAGTGRYVSGSP